MTACDKLRRSGAIVLAFSLAGCAAQPDGNGSLVADPYESFNRNMLDVNITLDRYALRPISQAYDFGVPETLQFVIANEIDYLSTPIDFANYLLQGEFRDAGVALARFTMNTTLGGLGMLDPATEFGLPDRETDFGITLGVWGVDEGPYLMLPFLGPALARDVPSYVVDRAFSPLTWLGYYGPLEDADGLSPGVRLLGVIDKRATNAEVVDQLFYETRDPYVTLRSAYVQRRRAKVAGPEGMIENLPDIYDEESAE